MQYNNCIAIQFLLATYFSNNPLLQYSWLSCNTTPLLALQVTIHKGVLQYNFFSCTPLYCNTIFLLLQYNSNPPSLLSCNTIPILQYNFTSHSSPSFAIQFIAYKTRSQYNFYHSNPSLAKQILVLQYNILLLATLHSNTTMSQYNACIVTQYPYFTWAVAQNSLISAPYFFFVFHHLFFLTLLLDWKTKKNYILFFFIYTTGDTKKLYINFFFSNTSNKFIKNYFHSFFFNFTHCKTLRKIFLLIKFFFHISNHWKTLKKIYMPIFFFIFHNTQINL